MGKAKILVDGQAMTEGQQRFVEEYLVDLNAKQAALRAHYAPNSARHAARNLMRRPAVAAAIRAGLAARRERLQISADRVMLELARIAFSDIGRLVDWDKDGVTLKPKESLSDADLAAVAEISGDGPRIKMHDKRRALEALGRHLGLFEHRGIIGDPRERNRIAEHAREILMERIANYTKRTALEPPEEPKS
jgi:phage terminase small subunit